MGYKAEYEEHIKVSLLGEQISPLALGIQDQEQIKQMIFPYSTTFKYSLSSGNVYLAFWSFYNGSCWTSDVWVRENDFRLLRTGGVRIEHVLQNQSIPWDGTPGVIASYGIQVLSTKEIDRRGVYGTGPATGLATTRGDKLK